MNVKVHHATDQDGDHERDPYCRRTMMMHLYAFMKASPSSRRFTSSVTIFDVLRAPDQRDYHGGHRYAQQKASPSSGRFADPSSTDGGSWKGITQFSREGATRTLSFTTDRRAQF